MEMLDVVNVADKLARVHDRWTPRIIADVSGAQVKVVKVEGEFVWHAHADEDELFWVVRGHLEIELRDGSVGLGPGDLVVVPRGVEHRPIAREEVHLVLIEPSGIRHTGDTIDPRTVTEYERL